MSLYSGRRPIRLVDALSPRDDDIVDVCVAKFRRVRQDGPAHVGPEEARLGKVRAAQCGALEARVGQIGPAQ